MEYAISLGADILMYPEGTLNKTENLIVQKLFTGIYDVAIECNALIVPIAIVRRVKVFMPKPVMHLIFVSINDRRGLLFCAI